jgi:3-hydroxyacyl-CoA dehydrogenase / enoyl-CoA hydratase / 3-hydroxybutyryl-CoA epimerase
MIRWEHRPDGIVILTLDDPEQSTNTMNARYRAAMASTVARLSDELASITGVVVTSAKDSFLAGADLKELMAMASNGGGVGATAYRLCEEAKANLRRLERLGRPVVAALNGSALGGGLEVALACHHRIAVDRPQARFGLPEVTLGLLPGGGGVTRVTRMLGVQDALMNVLLQGQRMAASRAQRTGLVDDLVETLDDLIPRAVEWIKANPDLTRQPWDRDDDYRIPGGRPSDKGLAAMLPAFPANLRKQLKGAHYPAPHAILCAAVEGATVDVDTAFRIESRWLASLVGTPVQRNMTQAFFFDLGHLNRGGSRPKDVPTSVARRVGVVGAGMMGAGIAYATARVGIDVVLVDVSLDAAERGKAHSRQILDTSVAKGRCTADERDAHLARITSADDLSALTGCDVVIEAVFEDLDLKRETFAKVATIVGPDALLASNTSSLPITSIAQAVPDPGRVCGLHFFSPVDKMPLVEIVRGEQTSDAALARAHDVVRQLDKTPIAVKDSRGFFTSRVFATYVLEGVALLGEGVPAASVEQAALQAGYPVGPLAVTDEVTLTLARKVRDEARKAGSAFPSHPGEIVVSRMIDEYGRTGKSSGKGFYDYPADGSPKRLWPRLAEAFGSRVPAPVELRDMQERLLFAGVIESVRCFDEGVLTSTADANIGSLFGIGFPPWTGGVLQYVETYSGGVTGFVARARELAARYGARFTPPDSLASSRTLSRTSSRAGLR